MKLKRRFIPLVICIVMIFTISTFSAEPIHNEGTEHTHEHVQTDMQKPFTAVIMLEGEPVRVVLSEEQYALYQEDNAIFNSAESVSMASTADNACSHSRLQLEFYEYDHPHSYIYTCKDCGKFPIYGADSGPYTWCYTCSRICYPECTVIDEIVNLPDICRMSYDKCSCGYKSNITYEGHQRFAGSSTCMWRSEGCKY